MSVDEKIVEDEVIYDAREKYDASMPTVDKVVIPDRDKPRIPVLEMKGLGIDFGELTALDDFSLTVGPTEIAGIIGPYSLASRLMDVSKTMIYCFDEPDMVHIILEKSTDFLIQYSQAFKDAGANGVIMAEPLTGLLSPGMAAEFSHAYVKQIIDEVQTDDFAVFYHNCGNNVPFMISDIYQLGASGYHFGDAISMMDVLPQAPHHVLVMGNISPSQQFKGGTPDTIRLFELLVIQRVRYSSRQLLGKHRCLFCSC